MSHSECILRRLVPLVQANDWGPQRHRLERLLKLQGSAGVRLLTVLLDHPESRVRIWAITQLELQQAADAERLLPVFRDADPTVRTWAAFALACVGDQRALEPLLSIARDDQVPRGDRFHALQGLGRLGDPRAIPHLAAFLRGQTEWNMVNQATCALCAMGVLAVDALLGVCEARVDLRSSLCYSLGRLGDARALPLARSLLGDDDASCRAAALFALERLGLAGDKRRVVLLLNDPSAMVRKRAICCAAALGAIEALRCSLHDEDMAVRREAVKAIGTRRPPWAVEVLVEVLADDGEPYVRFEAAVQLGEMRAVAAECLLQRFLARIPKLFRGKTRKAALRSVTLALARIRQEVRPECLRSP